MIEKFKAKYVKKITQMRTMSRNENKYEEFKSRKDHLNMDKAPATKEELKAYIETHRVHMKPMADLYVVVVFECVKFENVIKLHPSCRIFMFPIFTRTSPSLELEHTSL